MRRGADAEHRRVELPEAVLCDVCRDLGTEARELHGLVATTTRCVFATDAAIVSVSSGTSVRGSTTSTLTPSGSSSRATLRACGTIAPSATRVTSVPARTTFAVPSSIA